MLKQKVTDNFRLRVARAVPEWQEPTIPLFSHHSVLVLIRHKVKWVLTWFRVKDDERPDRTGSLIAHCVNENGCAV